MVVIVGHGGGFELHPLLLVFCAVPGLTTRIDILCGKLKLFTSGLQNGDRDENGSSCCCCVAEEEKHCCGEW